MDITPVVAAEVDSFLSLVHAGIAASPYYTEEAKGYEATLYTRDWAL